MNNFFLSIIKIFNHSWFLQGVSINSFCALFSIPFTRNFFQKVFRNRKRNRIESSRNELLTYCLKQLIEHKYINNTDFENQLYLIAIKYELDEKDICEDKNAFIQNVMPTLSKEELISNDIKKKIANKIRKNEIFIASEDQKKIIKNNNSISNKKIDYSKKDNNKSNSEINKSVKENGIVKIYNIFTEKIRDYSNDHIQLNQKEKKDIFKYTSITTGIIFIILLLYDSLWQVLGNKYGDKSIIFINTIVILIATIPILVNGIINLSKFNKQNKIFFGFLLLISVLNIMNFIYIINILLY